MQNMHTQDLARSWRFQDIQRWTKKAGDIEQNEIFENLWALKDENEVQIVRYIAKSCKIFRDLQRLSGGAEDRRESPDISPNRRNIINFVQQGPS